MAEKECEMEPTVVSIDVAEQNRIQLQFIEDVTANADQIQKQVLHEILTNNADVEYLQRHGLKGHTDRDTFKKLIPVITYEDIQSDIKRIVGGDTSPILCSKPFAEILSSSATSGGQKKLIPLIKEDIERRILQRSLVFPVMSQFIPNLERGKGLYFFFTRPENKTPAGLVARPSTTSYYKSSHFQRRPYFLNFTSPNETILCTDYFQSAYSQLLCGLYQRKKVLRVGATFATGFVRVIRFLEKHWPLLCKDIRTGILNDQITDPSVREAVVKVFFKPDPELADLVEAECGKSCWQGIIPRLWPEAKYIDAIVTGSMSQYIPTLEYYGGGLPLVSSRYGGTEFQFGLNLNPLCKPNEVSYTVIPTHAYFEFLPVKPEIEHIMDSFPGNEKWKQELVDLVDVELGQEYELVVTTCSGLYRYRVGDVLRVTGFKHRAPQFSFSCRKNAVLSLDMEKTDEVDIQTAMKNAVKHLEPFGAIVGEYTCYADVSTMPGHYVVYWEINGSTPIPIPCSVFEDCCLSFEESLNSVYRRHRNIDESIGPLEIKIVEYGTFDKVMDHAIALGASVGQYKTPSCVKAPHIVDLLDSCVVSNYFSPRCPQFSYRNQ